MFLSEKQIKDYQIDGVIIVKDIFKDWIEPLRKGFQKVLDNPSKHGRENVDRSKGRFFEDYCNWEIIEEFKECIFNSPGAQIVAEATNSKSTQIFHEHIFIKEPGTYKETPWHQDMPYYCVDGNHTGSFWIPLDEVDRKNNLKLIPLNGGEVGPPLSIYFTSSPINLIENALRDLEVLFPVEPCTVLKLNNTASPKLSSGIKIFFLNISDEGKSIKELSFLYHD